MVRITPGMATTYGQESDTRPTILLSALIGAIAVVLGAMIFSDVSEGVKILFSLVWTAILVWAAASLAGVFRRLREVRLSSRKRVFWVRNSKIVLDSLGDALDAERALVQGGTGSLSRVVTAYFEQPSTPTFPGGKKYSQHDVLPIIDIPLSCFQRRLQSMRDLSQRIEQNARAYASPLVWELRDSIRELVGLHDQFAYLSERALGIMAGLKLPWPQGSPFRNALDEYNNNFATSVQKLEGAIACFDQKASEIGDPRIGSTIQKRQQTVVFP